MRFFGGNKTIIEAPILQKNWCKDFLLNFFNIKILNTSLKGLCHTLKDGYDIEKGSKGIFFALNPQLRYLIFIHDQKYHIQGWEPLPTPGIRLFILEEKFFIRKYFSVTRHMKINQKTHPCIEDISYDFTLCVRNWVTSTIGCRQPWDTRISSGYPVCSEIDDIYKGLRLKDEINLSELEDIVKKTGCAQPCSYKEYKLALEPEKIGLGSSNETVVLLAFNDNHVITEKEVESYGIVSLVSDVGGSLGLFLGFSFFMVWDVIEVAFKALQKFCK